MTWQIVILAFAIVFLALAASNTPAPARVSWGWLGMLLWLIVETFWRALR